MSEKKTKFFSLKSVPPELNKLIGTALTDQEFAARLLADPFSTIESLSLTAEQRQAVLNAAGAEDLTEFAKLIEEGLKNPLLPDQK